MSSSPKQPEPPVFFIDRSLGKHVVANALRQAGCDVRVHDDLFRQDASDDEWLAQVGKNGWIVLTKDKNIRFRESEKQALVASRVRAFVLTAHDVTGPEIADIFVRAMPSILKLARGTPAPFLARITRSGQVALLPIRPIRK